jgi:hypothetical protein
MVEFVRANHPEKFKALEEDKTRALIRQGVAKAASHGIKAENNVAGYVNLMVQLEPDFETRKDLPWIKGVLGNPDLSEDAKMRLIHKRLPPEAAGSPPR